MPGCAGPVLGDGGKEHLERGAAVRQVLDARASAMDLGQTAHEDQTGASLRWSGAQLLGGVEETRAFARSQVR